MIIKVCGLREPKNILEVAALNVQMLGFIFYPPSKRYVGDTELPMTTGVERVGVFVNPELEFITQMIQHHSLTAIQLHGDESVELCQSVKNLGVKLFKAISIATAADLEQTTKYQAVADIFIFDTKCDGYGGSGERFDWNTLSAYRGETPYLLSGGISPEDAPQIMKITDPRMLGVDLNSRFETAPALKNIDKLKQIRMELNMNNNIDKLFTEKDSNILSVYYPAGFPELNSTMEVLTKLQNAGVNMVELGIPFSDPMADGVVIQEAANRALTNGMSLKLLFEQITDMRSTITIPVILMGYINPIMKFGFENFCRKCAEVGVDGVIIPDMPFEVYESEYKDIAKKYGVKVIMLITPETSDERINKIDSATSGFIYMVSSASTTGAKNEFDPATLAYFQRVAAMKLRNKRLIGFGISNNATYTAACSNANGAIIGSQFVKLLAQSDSIDTAIATLKSNLGV